MKCFLYLCIGSGMLFAVGGQAFCIASSQSAIDFYNNAMDCYRGSFRDYPKALEYFIKAADLGNIDAQLELAFIYRDGIKDIPKDDVKAEYYFRKGCFNSDQLVCQNIKANLHLYDENNFKH